LSFLSGASLGLWSSYLHTWLILLDRVLLTFLPRLTSSHHPPISTNWAVVIIGMKQYMGSWLCYFLVHLWTIFIIVTLSSDSGGNNYSWRSYFMPLTIARMTHMPPSPDFFPVDMESHTW
jgi:hypothetical protein